MRYLLPGPPTVCLLLANGCGKLDYYGDDLQDADPGDGQANPGDDDDDDDDDNGPNTTDPTDPTDTTDPGEPPVDIEIDSVDPEYGTNGGTVEVTLEGSFDAGTTVEFGGEEATILSQTGSTIVVLAPEQSLTGFVDVEALSGTRSDTRADAFQYFEDATGRGATYGYVQYYGMVGDYWLDGDFALGMASYPDGNGTTWEFWKDYVGAMNTCEYSSGSIPTPSMYEPNVATLVYDHTSSAKTISLSELTAVGLGVYGNNAVPTTDVVAGGLYDLLGDSNDPDWPVFDVPDAIEIPSAFSVTAPVMAPSPADIFRNNFRLTWTGGGGDYVVIYVLRENLTSGQTNGWVTCAVDDTGSFTIPSSTWPDWATGQFLHVQVGRVIEGTGVLPHNNGENRLVGVYTVYGGGVSN